MVYTKRKYVDYPKKTYKRPKYNPMYPSRYTRSSSTTVNRGYGGMKGPAAEQKFIDSGLISATANTTGQLTLLNGCAPGSTASTRVGTKSVMTSVQIHGQAYTDTTAVTVNVACYLFWDKNPNGVVPGVTDYLVTANPTSYPNLNNRERFTTLWKWKTTLIGAAATPTSAGSITLPDYYKKLNLNTIYNAGTAGTIGDINQGALYFLTLSDVTAGTADSFVQFSARVRFLD